MKNLMQNLETIEYIRDLQRRLTGEYRIPITDGLGSAGGDEPENNKEFVRHFPVPPIQQEAARTIGLFMNAIDHLLEEINNAKSQKPET